ncbi:MAG TPA: substrate-binding domain-containing protein [Anaerolineae bacterium]|nr:substrate-binding domain-containing protein [Anaerolineae bacterium]
MSCKHIALLPILVLMLAACASAAQPAPASNPAPPGETKVLRLATTTSTDDSGLLDAILPDFEARCGCRVDVVAVGTGQALEIGAKGDADVVLVHSRKAEDKFVTEGHARERFDVMYNDFIVVGPRDDPAQIAGLAAAKDAFEAIMNSQALFASRGDKSGTHSKELSIWSSLNITPTAEMLWYKSLGQGMGETLVFANEQRAYALADRGTYLSMSDGLPNLAVLVGGANLSENKDEALLNPYGVMAVNPDLHPGVRFDLAMQFIDWLTSPETQAKIGSYGADKYGQPLFYPNAGR